VTRSPRGANPTVFGLVARASRGHLAAHSDGDPTSVSFVRREQNGEARLSTKRDPSTVIGDV